MSEMLEDYVVIDLEMTGLRVKTDAILEVGAVRVRGGAIEDTYSAVLNARRPLTDEIIEITGITREMMETGREPEEALAEYFEFIGEDVIVGHNVIYDYSFLKQWAVNHNLTFERNAVDTLKIARKMLPEDQKKDLGSLCAYFDVNRENAHRALDDAIETAEIFERMKAKYQASDEEAFKPRPLQYKVKKQTPATARQLEHLRRYAEAYNLELPEYIESLSRSEASRLIDKWIFTYGRLGD